MDTTFNVARVLVEESGDCTKITNDKEVETQDLSTIIWSVYQRADNTESCIADFYGPEAQADATEFAGRKNNFCPPGVTFPNGVVSFLETHYHASAAVCIASEKYPNLTTAYRDQGGTTALMTLAQELTTKFEELHKGEEWFEKDYYDTIDAFLEAEIYGPFNTHK